MTDDKHAARVKQLKLLFAKTSQQNAAESSAHARDSAAYGNSDAEWWQRRAEHEYRVARAWIGDETRFDQQQLMAAESAQ